MSNFTRCAACRYLRRRCCEDCTLAPFFPSTNPTRFAYVHRVFGASNVARMLQQIPVEQRRQAADAIALEAYWRVQDPVYGSVGVISRLQREINVAQRELAETQAHIALYAARVQSPSTQFDPSIRDNRAPEN
ncbi:LOB domain-containing protein 24-like [Zingiber officinale]|uniref:LOB domain-containing protein 24-like n=1 Tax=Zingiber officinale TaxID=94328 RepID=UPI001C4CE674|nr:LOB domain-containing protein 24-like [Zingiber officinale]